MTRYPPLPLAFAALALAAPACLGDFGIDDARFACTSNAQCGAGARCIDGVCFVGDASPPDADANPPDVETTETDTGETPEEVTPGFVCAAPTFGTPAGGTANFQVQRDGERAVIVVTYDGLTTTVPLPPDVVIDFDDGVGPLDTCCEHPCCPAYSL